MRALGWMLVCIVSGCAAGTDAPRSPDTGARWLRTTLDYHASSAQGVESFLGRDGDGGALRAVLERASPAVVRVRGSRSVAQDRRVETSFHGSGVLLAGGRWVVTAGHTGAGAAGARWEVRLADGRRRPARQVDAVHDGAEDWAILELANPVQDASGIAALGALVPGEPLVILGYPGNHGLDARGRVAVRGPDSRAPLLPLAAIARSPASGGASLEPLAGITDLAGGMSGGGAFDRRGDLVGLFVAMELRLDGEGGSTQSWRLSPASQLEARLRALGWSPNAEP